MRVFLLAILLTFSVTVKAGDSIGSVTENKGNACELQRGKNKLPGAKGSSVESMDTYITQACVSTLTFKDDTKVKVNENSKLLIDDFVFDPKKSDAGKLALKVGMGTVRYASGQIAKNNPQQVAVNTPTATVAVRGTDFSMTVDESGQSLVVLLPSCKDDSEQKKYELEEQRCKVGKIIVTNSAGSVELDKAFEATYVTSLNSRPSPPVVINTVESKIGNNLILVRPIEVAQAMKEAAKTKQDKELEEIEAEAARRVAQRVKDNADAIEQARILAMMEAAGKAGCNPSTNICVVWTNPEAQDIQTKGRGTAFRTNEDHYAEVKTQGYSSNTRITIVHNDAPATELIGDGSGGGNVVYIKQNSGVLRR
jgi:hypothetical protein